MLVVSVEQQSNGGSLTFQADNELFIANDARLHGGPGQASDGGASSAQGGDLVILSKTLNAAVLPTSDLLDVAQHAPVFHYSGLGQQVTNATSQPYADGLGLTWFGVDSFSMGQYGALTLSTGQSGEIQIEGANVSISANRQVSIANHGILAFASGVTASNLILSAPYVVLGPDFQPPSASGAKSQIGSSVAPVAGNGSLVVRASTLIDVGDLSLQNASTLTLDATYQGQTGATNGAIRGDGTLDVAGAITLKAGQIYPPTATTFDINAYDFASASDGTLVRGSVTILPAGGPTLPSLPLSAGGTLNIYASVINQGGVVRAPLGTINLGVRSGGDVDVLNPQLRLPSTSSLTLQPGSITSVSAVAPEAGPVTVPYGIMVNGGAWIDPSAPISPPSDRMPRPSRSPPIRSIFRPRQPGSLQPAWICKVGAMSRRTSSCPAPAARTTYCPAPRPAHLPLFQPSRIPWHRTRSTPQTPLPSAVTRGTP